MTGKKTKHGGKRKGSGAPKKEPTKVLSFRVPAKKATVMEALIKRLIKESTKTNP
jgi:hypothetical protein